MRTPCIRHPKDHPLIIIHRWQIEACDGDVCAAALMSYFEYWHGIRLAQAGKSLQQNLIAEAHGEDGTQDISLYQFHNEDELERGVMIYRKNTIAKSLKLLESKGFISIRNNPASRYKFDRTRYFLFHPVTVQKWIDEHYSPEQDSAARAIDDASPKNGPRSPKSGESNSKNGAPSTEFGAPSPVIRGQSTKNGAPSLRNGESSNTKITPEIAAKMSMDQRSESEILDEIFASLSDGEKAQLDREAAARLELLGVFGNRPVALQHMRRHILREQNGL